MEGGNNIRPMCRVWQLVGRESDCYNLQSTTSFFGGSFINIGKKKLSLSRNLCPSTLPFGDYQ